MSDRSSCSVEPDVLSAFMDEELPEERMKELREHVRTCDRCDDRLSRLREAQRVARTVDPPSAPDSFVSDVRERINQETADERPESSGREARGTGKDPEQKEEPSGTSTAAGSLFEHPGKFAAAAVLLLAVTVGLVVVFQLSRQASDSRVASKATSTDGNSSDSSNVEGGLDKQKRKDGEVGSRNENQSSTEADSLSRSADRHTEENRELAKKASAKGKGEDVEKEQYERGKNAGKKRNSRARRNTSSSEDGSEPTLSPVLVRLRGERDAVMKELTSALSALDPDRVELRAVFPAEVSDAADQEAQSTPFSDEKDVEKWGNVRTLSLDISTERLSKLLNQRAKLELNTSEDEAKLFLGALVQQGQSPSVLTTKPDKLGGTAQFALDEARGNWQELKEKSSEEESQEQKADEAGRDTERFRQSVVTLQRSNVQLQACRTEWTQKSAKNSGTAATGESISLPTLRRFIEQYEREREDGQKQGVASETETSDTNQAAPSEEGSGNRRRVLRDWITFLERRPSSWSAPVEEDTSEEGTEEEAKSQESLQKRTQQAKQLGKGKLEQYFDIHLRVRDGSASSTTIPDADRPSSSIQERPEEK